MLVLCLAEAVTTHALKRFWLAQAAKVPIHDPGKQQTFMADKLRATGLRLTFHKFRRSRYPSVLPTLRLLLSLLLLLRLKAHSKWFIA